MQCLQRILRVKKSRKKTPRSAEEKVEWRFASSKEFKCKLHGEMGKRNSRRTNNRSKCLTICSHTNTAEKQTCFIFGRFLSHSYIINSSCAHNIYLWQYNYFMVTAYAVKCRVVELCISIYPWKIIIKQRPTTSTSNKTNAHTLKNVEKEMHFCGAFSFIRCNYVVHLWCKTEPKAWA